MLAWENVRKETYNFFFCRELVLRLQLVPVEFDIKYKKKCENYRERKKEEQGLGLEYWSIYVKM